MTFIMKNDEAPNPIDIGLLSANAVMFDAQMSVNTIEELRRRSTDNAWGDGVGSLTGGLGNARLMTGRQSDGKTVPRLLPARFAGVCLKGPAIPSIILDASGAGNESGCP